jgi:hypothetical protein
VWGVWGEIISSQFLLFPLFPLFPIPVSTDNLLNLTVLPKYLWASPEKSHRKNEPSVHLKNGELPLAFFNPVGQPHKLISRWFKGQNIIPVALTEGVAFKSAITAQRLGIFTLGASGGHFASSPECLKAYLARLGKIPSMEYNRTQCQGINILSL